MTTTLATTRRRRRLSPRVRRAILTVHIAASVGLLGDVAAVLAVNVRAATTADPQLAASSYELLAMFSILFGIPLSMLSLATGLTLGAGSKWGVLRYRWVAGKLLLLLSVLAVGAFVLGPATDAMREGRGDAEAAPSSARSGTSPRCRLRRGCPCSSRAGACGDERAA